MAIARQFPHIWTTWLPRLLTGENSCEWAIWFKAHHQNWAKAPPSDFNQAEWVLNHTSLLNEKKSQWEARGHDVYVEGQNSGSQLALFANYSYHAFITDRDGETLALEADHRRHAEIENAIRDLKYGVGLNHLPSGRFPANGAWLAVQVIAHNLARWTARIGLGEQLVTTKTLRRRFFSLTGRLTRSARRLTLHLPQGWPWENQFSRALARFRALPLPS